MRLETILRNKDYITEKDHAPCGCGQWECWFDIYLYTADYGQVDHATYCYSCGRLFILHLDWYEFRLTLDQSPQLEPFNFPNLFLPEL